MLQLAPAPHRADALEQPRRLLDELVVVNGGVGRGGWTEPALLEMSDREIAFSSYLASKDPDNECPHGRLLGDASPACGCYPSEVLTPVPRPVQAPAVSHEEARQLMSTIEAPFGYKKDGTPRKRPVPTAAIEAAKRARQAKKPAATPTAARALLSGTPDITASIDARLAELRDEETRLEKARAALAA